MSDPAPRPVVAVLNGWAASPRAWDRCRFPRETGARLFSYTDCLDGAPDRLFAPGARVALVGWSMGGSCALRLACEHPDAVAGLVLVAATPRMMEDRATGWAGMNERRLEALRRGFELTGGGGLFGVPEGYPDPYMADDPASLERGLGYLRETDLRARLESTRFPPFPVRVVHSERDAVVRPENAAYLARVFPGAKVRMVPGSEHALPVFAPEAVDEAVAEVLARPGGRGEFASSLPF